MKKALNKAICLSLLLSAWTANHVFAAGWEQTDNTWKYQNEDGTFLSNGWNWLDGNKDGISECYYFDGEGRLLVNTSTPDGYTVNTDGAWIVDNVVQTKNTSQTGDSAQTADSTQTSFYGTPTADGYANSWAGFRYSSSDYILSGEDVLDYVDFAAYPSKDEYFPNLWFAFETADYDSEEAWIQQTADVSAAFGYTVERTNHTRLGDGNSYTLLKLTYGNLHEDYWMRSINGTFVYFRLIYTNSCADRAAAFLPGIKPY